MATLQVPLLVVHGKRLVFALLWRLFGEQVGSASSGVAGMAATLLYHRDYDYVEEYDLRGCDYGAGSIFAGPSSSL